MIDFVLANSVDPDEMLLYAAFHLGLHCLLKYLFWGFEGLSKIANGYLCLTKTILVLTDKFNNFSKSNFFLHMHVSLCIFLCAMV